MSRTREQAEGLRNYGKPFSEAESQWSPEVKKRMTRGGRGVVWRSLRPLQRLAFVYRLFWTMRRARRLDLSAIRSRGMNNQAFLDLQLEYLAVFAAVAQVVGAERAVEIFKEVMEVTAREPLLLCLPEPEAVQAMEDPFAVFREYFRAAPAAAQRAGCHEISVEVEGEDAFQMNITGCVWLELARAMQVPEACLPNCYADDLVFPDYFGALGIDYRRSGTLAQGKSHCDFRFERRKE